MGYLAPGLVDAHVGKRLKEKRVALDLDQAQFALALNTTPKLIDGYERGIIRISAEKMYDISKGLSLPVAYFH